MGECNYICTALGVHEFRPHILGTVSEKRKRGPNFARMTDNSERPFPDAVHLKFDRRGSRVWTLHASGTEITIMGYMEFRLQGLRPRKATRASRSRLFANAVYPASGIENPEASL